METRIVGPKWRQWGVALALIGLVTSDAWAAQRGEMAAPPPIESSSLFTVPTGRVVRSLDLDLTGSGLFLGNDSTLPLGSSLLFGLGDIAQVELGTLGFVDNTVGTSTLASVPSGGLKVFLPLWRHWHGVALSFQRSGKRQVEVEGRTFDQQVGRFALVTTLANFVEDSDSMHPDTGWNGIKIKSHLGLSYIDPRMDPEGPMGGVWRPMGGLEVWRSDSRARIMGEFDWLPRFHADGRIDEVWQATGGVRFFFTKHTALDIGVRYQSDLDGLSQSLIHSKFRLSLPTHLVRQRLVGR